MKDDGYDPLFITPDPEETVVLVRPSPAFGYPVNTRCRVVGVPKHGCKNPQDDLIRVQPIGAPEHLWFYIFRDYTAPADKGEMK